MGVLQSLKKLLIYGGISKENYYESVDEVNKENKKNIVAFSVVGVVAFVLALVLSFFNPPMVNNRLIYVGAAAILLLIIGICKVTNGNKYAVNIFIYLYMSIMFGAGIYLGAFTGIEELASTFMVLLFAVPLLFTARPVYCAALIILADVVFIAMLHINGQEAVLMGKNTVNAFIYGFISVAVSTVMMRIKYERISIGIQNKYLSETDQLSGLLNRRAFDYRCREVAEYTEVGVVFCDLNALKYTNDNFGHEEGDKLIVNFSKLLLESFGKADSFRISGDEFVVILPGIEQGKFNDNVDKFKGIIAVGEYPMACLGSAYGNGKAVRELVKSAEDVMYEEKQIFRSKYEKFSR